MLIRSQSKEVLVNVDNLAGMGLEEAMATPVIVCCNSGCAYVLGKYSSREKSMKVLDMLQEAYAENYMLANVFENIGIMPLKKSDQNAFRDIKNDFQTKIVFQMPQDSEVE